LLGIQCVSEKPTSWLMSRKHLSLYASTDDKK